MPIHLIWGDDYEASNREIEEIINNFIDPLWKSFNYSQIDGNNPVTTISQNGQLENPTEA